jgi:hypothetical protein
MHLGRARTARATVALALAFAQASGASERCSTAPIRPTQQRAGDASGTQGLLLAKEASLALYSWSSSKVPAAQRGTPGRCFTITGVVCQAHAGVAGFADRVCDPYSGAAPLPRRDRPRFAYGVEHVPRIGPGVCGTDIDRSEFSIGRTSRKGHSRTHLGPAPHSAPPRRGARRHLREPQDVRLAACFAACPGMPELYRPRPGRALDVDHRQRRSRSSLPRRPVGEDTHLLQLERRHDVQQRGRSSPRSPRSCPFLNPAYETVKVAASDEFRAGGRSITLRDNREESP